MDKLSLLLRDLWSKKLNEINALSELFEGRLIALNKAHPNIPQKSEFRPIIILSLIVKIMESRWLPKLKEYMISKMCPAQTGFVPGQGVFTNIFRAIKRIKYRTDQKKPALALFIDFKSAYNYARHDLIFERLESILEQDEINFQKAIYDKIIIRSGKSQFRPNTGVAQGSVISPALFDIYLEPLLWELNKIIPLNDIFAYADDVLVLCDDLDKLEKCINIIERWSGENNLKINKNKSAILEFMHRRKKVTSLTVGETFLGYPVVEKYKYLGTWLNQKLTLDTHLTHIQQKTFFIRKRLSPTLYNASLDFRKNLWQIFVAPLYEFVLPLFKYEQSKTKRERAETLLRKSFKSYTCLKKTVKTDLINDLMGYELTERSEYLYHVSEQKWIFRERGEAYKQSEDKCLPAKKQSQHQNLCKNMPKMMVKYINMQTALCPKCKQNGRLVACSRDHLEYSHDILIDTIYQLTEKLKTPKEARSRECDNVNKKRATALKAAETLIQINIEKIEGFLNCEPQK